MAISCRDGPSRFGRDLATLYASPAPLPASSACLLLESQIHLLLRSICSVPAASGAATPSRPILTPLPVSSALVLLSQIVISVQFIVFLTVLASKTLRWINQRRIKSRVCCLCVCVCVLLMCACAGDRFLVSS